MCLLESLGDMAKKAGADFLIGGGTYEKNPEGSLTRYTAYNSCYHFTKDV